MGHTVWSQRIVSDSLIRELQNFSKALREEDRVVYLRMMKQPLKYLGVVSYTSSAHTWAVLLLATMLEQQKRIEKLETELLSYRCLSS